MKSIEKMREWANSGKLYDNARRFVLHFADEIEAEVAERYMARPLDADGVPVSIGDELTRPMIGGKAYEVEELRYDGDTWWFESGEGCYACDCASHVKPDPLKELLEEFAYKVCDLSVSEESATEYAERIRELLGADDR